MSSFHEALNVVQKAIDADNCEEYEDALVKYRKALDLFTEGLKHETNEERKRLILGRLEGYTRRAGEISEYLQQGKDADSFYPAAINTVAMAIEEDNKGDYEKALPLYRDAILGFTNALKHETNEARKALIRDRVEEYLRRAEKLSAFVRRAEAETPRTSNTHKHAIRCSPPRETSSTSLLHNSNDDGPNELVLSGIDIVSKAVLADSEGDYVTALNLYRDALARFTSGVRHETNQARKSLILNRIDGYLRRAEELKDHLDTQEADDKENLRRSLHTETPNVKWDDVAGFESAKELLWETVVTPCRFPQVVSGMPIGGGILLCGPNGIGKTHLVNAVLTECNKSDTHIQNLHAMHPGENRVGQTILRQVFEKAREEASATGRAIVVLDEFDTIFQTTTTSSNHDSGEHSGEAGESSCRVEAEFLFQMKNRGNGVIVLATTTAPWNLSENIRQSFPRSILLPLPDQKARTAIVTRHLRDTPNDLTTKQLERLSEGTEGASPADLVVWVKDALLERLRECQRAKHFLPVEDSCFVPCFRYPNCPSCPTKAADNDKCGKCGARRMAIWDVPHDKLKVRNVKYKDFAAALERKRGSHWTVSAKEMRRFQEWALKNHGGLTKGRPSSARSKKKA